MVAFAAFCALIAPLAATPVPSDDLRGEALRLERLGRWEHAMGYTKKLSRSVGLSLGTIVGCLTLGGCLVSSPPPRASYGYEQYEYEEPVQPVQAVQPVYFEGFQVHFDTVGLPFVYVGSNVRYVPRSHPRYASIVRYGHGPRRGDGYGPRRHRSYRRY